MPLYCIHPNTIYRIIPFFVCNTQLYFTISADLCKFFFRETPKYGILHFVYDQHNMPFIIYIMMLSFLLHSKLLKQSFPVLPSRLRVLSYLSTLNSSNNIPSTSARYFIRKSDKDCLYYIRSAHSADYKMCAQRRTFLNLHLLNSFGNNNESSVCLGIITGRQSEQFIAKTCRNTCIIQRQGRHFLHIGRKFLF